MLEKLVFATLKEQKSARRWGIFFKSVTLLVIVVALATYMDVSWTCLLYTSPSPRDGLLSRMPSSA